MAPDKDKDKALSVRDIEAMLQRPEQEEKARHKRARKAAKRYANRELTAEEEDVATKIRRQLANTSGYLYNPNYQYANLRMEPPCDTPEYSEYTKKQMREEKEAQGKRNKIAEGPQPETSAKDVVSHNEAKLNAGVPTKEEIDKFAEEVMPNIQRLSMLAYSAESSEDDDDTAVAHRSDMKSDSGSVMTAVLHAEISTLHSTKELRPVETTACFTPSPPQPSDNSESTPGIPTIRPRSYGANSGAETTVGGDLGKLDTAERIHPWPNLWPDDTHKGPQFDLKQWSVINAYLGTHNGAIKPCDQENHEAYKQVSGILVSCWLVMTGQVSPVGNKVALELVKPMLQKEKSDMTAKLRLYEEKLVLRRKALNLPVGDWKRSSTGSDKSASFSSTPTMATPSRVSTPPPGPSFPVVDVGNPFPPFISSPMIAGSFTDSYDSPCTSRRSSSTSNRPFSADSDKRSSTQFEFKPAAAESDSKGTSAHTSFDGQSGSLTPSKRGKLATFTNVLRTPKMPKSPKKGTKSQEGSASADGQILTTSKGAPPVPIIPASFSGQDTPETSFEGVRLSKRNTPLLKASPAFATLHRKVSRSFGGTSGTVMAETPNKKTMSFDGTLGIGSSVTKTSLTRANTSKVQSASFSGTSSGSKMSSAVPEGNLFSMKADTPATPMSTDLNFASISDWSTPNASTVDLDMPKRTNKHSRTSSGDSTHYNDFDAHLNELLNEFRVWGSGNDSSKENNDNDPERPNVKELLKPIDKDQIRKLTPRELEAMANQVKKITHADLRAQVVKEHYDARFPSSATGHHATSFVALPHMALRIASYVLDTVNKRFLPQLNCDYEIRNYRYADAERRWHAANPYAKNYPYAGISRPSSPSYLKAGYAAVWATRFVQWAQEQQQLWMYENVDLPTMGEPGGGFRRRGRTLEAKLLLNMVDEQVQIDMATGELNMEGDGAMLKEDKVQEMVEQLAKREDEKGTKMVWAACEEQISRLAMIMGVERAEDPEPFGSGRSSLDEDCTKDPQESPFARAGLTTGL